MISEEKSDIYTKTKEPSKEQDNNGGQRRKEFRNFRARLHKNTSEHKFRRKEAEPENVEQTRVISPLNLMDIFDGEEPPSVPNPLHKMV